MAPPEEPPDESPELFFAADFLAEAFFDAFTAAGHAQHDINQWFIRGGAKPHLDLWRANADQLAKMKTELTKQVEATK